MVVIADVDFFLNKNDFMLLQESAWPWLITHFRIVEKCYGCAFPTNLSNRPHHFIIFDTSKIKDLINYDFFWCQQCAFYAIYDHYCEDECDYCY